MTRKQKEPKAERRPPIAIDPDRLTKGAMRLLSRMGGRRLHKEFTDDERVPAGAYYFMEPGGAKANREASEELIKKGRLRPLNDGLFADAEHSQTYEAAT